MLAAWYTSEVRVSYLSTLVGFTEIVDIAFAMIVIPARYNGIHTASLAFEGCGNSSIASTAFDLR